MKLRQQQIDQYFEDGFIIVEDLFTRDELQPEMDELAQRVEDMAQRLYETGRIKNKHEDRDFYTRLTHIENEFDGAAADWTIGQLRDPAQRIADRIEALMLNEHGPATETS